MPTTAQIMERSPIAQYLAANKISLGTMFNNRLDPLLSQKIFVVYFILKKIYDIDPTYSGVDKVAQMLWELQGRFGLTAASITGSGVVVTPTSTDLPPAPIDFWVDGSSFIPTGETTVVIPQFIGYNVNLDRGGQPQYTTPPPDGISTYYSWNIVTGTLVLLNGAANPPEQIRISPYR